MTQGKPKLLLPVLASIAVLLLVPATNASVAFAETEKPVVKVADHLKNNPLAIKIITEMEAQKLRYKQFQNEQSDAIKQQKQNEQTQLDQQRQKAQDHLTKRIQALEEKYKDYTPKAAFATFVQKKPDYTHSVFWGMFDYMQGKVDSARAAMKEVIDNGGSLKEARDAYFANAATKRVELIQVAQDLNVRHNLADKAVQDTFDEFGKLPRYD